jgi:hypothetical protein
MHGGRRRLRHLIAIGVTLIVAAPLAQSPDLRSDRASREALLLVEQWLGPPTHPASPPLATSSFPGSPVSMDVESRTALAVARRWWPQQATAMNDGASAYLAGKATERLFDLAFGRAGRGAATMRLFGGTYTIAFPQLVFDGPRAGYDRVAQAYLSLERLIGQPRLIGALRTVIERQPATDDETIAALSETLGQDVSWLFEAALNPSAAMDYAIGSVASSECEPAPCQRVEVAVTHTGAVSFQPIEVRVDFADGQTASATWDGKGEARTFTFEGPAAPTRVRVDPGFTNLLDDNLIDQHREIGGRTNASIAKWTARWIVWLQDAMLACSAIV